ncbi:hypothetical protein [Acinetobacter sp.]|uniref:hypothetical protein n=1 Tax=Acinetobacter sp. TaxID=472 RepID=UPI003752E58E
MKAKTIKAILSKKFNQWVESIESSEVKKLVKDNTIITGGSIASMLLKEEVNDFDLYFRNKETTLAVAKYYVDRFKAISQTKFKKDGGEVEIEIKDEPDRVKIYIKSAGIANEGGTDSYEYFESQPDEAAENYVQEVIDATAELDDRGHTEEEKAKYRPVFLTANAITLSDRVQLVLRFFGEPDAIHENYDFVHCTNYWSSWDHNLVLRPAALEALLAKELRYVGSKYPVCSIIRLRKFIKRGWMINAGQILKMCMQVSQLDLSNVKVLEDQLIGVDAAYFMQIIAQLAAKDPEKVDFGYLMTIIDRIF